MSAQKAGNVHVPALDGVRAVAVLAVFAFHAFSSHPTYGRIAFVRLGKFGVTVFFVLSGFLITLRLLDVADRDDLSRFGRWKVCFVRRVARIFPLYYATAALLALFRSALGFAYKVPVWPWLLTYTLNFRIAASILDEGRWLGPGHLWSLCVEDAVLSPISDIRSDWPSPMAGTVDSRDRPRVDRPPRLRGLDR